MLGLHTSSLHECSKSAVCKDGFSIAARPLLHNNPSVNGNNPPRNLKDLDTLPLQLNVEVDLGDGSQVGKGYAVDVVLDDLV